MTAGARQPRNSRILNVSWLPNSNWDRLMRAIWPVPQRWSHDAFRYASSSVRAPIKRAVIIAIQNCPGYPGLDNLSGPHNDIEMHKETLHLLDFNSENVKVLSDQEPRDSASYPNRQNIERELRELGSLQNGDLGFLAYSGHAVRGHGSDETYIVPADGNPNDRDTLIKPQELNRWLVRCLAPGATLLMLCDACHSEGILGLPFEYELSRRAPNGCGIGVQCKVHCKNLFAHAKLCIRQLRPYKEEESGHGLAICLSACGRDQTTREVRDRNSNKEYGLLTYCFHHYFLRETRNAMPNRPGNRYSQVAPRVQDILKEFADFFVRYKQEQMIHITSSHRLPNPRYLGDNPNALLAPDNGYFVPTQRSSR